MTRRKNPFSIRKPRIRLSNKGKLGFSPGSLHIGNNKARLNLSKTGPSASFGAGPLRYNTRRGASMRCLPMLALLAFAPAAAALWLLR